MLLHFTNETERDRAWAEIVRNQRALRSYIPALSSFYKYNHSDVQNSCIGYPKHKLKLDNFDRLNLAILIGWLVAQGYAVTYEDFTGMEKLNVE